MLFVRSHYCCYNALPHDGYELACNNTQAAIPIPVSEARVVLNLSSNVSTSPIFPRFTSSLKPLSIPVYGMIRYPHLPSLLFPPFPIEFDAEDAALLS